MIPRDFGYAFTYYEWQWFEPDPENTSRAPHLYKNVCKACGSIVVPKWAQGHARLHFSRKELAEGMYNVFGDPS